MKSEVTMEKMLKSAIEELTYYQETTKFLDQNLANLKKQVPDFNNQVALAQQSVIDAETLLAHAKSFDIMEIRNRIINWQAILIQALRRVWYTGKSLVKLGFSHLIISVVIIALLVFFWPAFGFIIKPLFVIGLLVFIGINMLNLGNRARVEKQQALDQALTEHNRLGDYEKELIQAKEKLRIAEANVENLKQLIKQQKEYNHQFAVDFKHNLESNYLYLSLFPTTFQNSLERLTHAYAILADGAGNKWSELAAIVRSEEHMDKINDSIKKRLVDIKQQLQTNASKMLAESVKIERELNITKGTMKTGLATLRDVIKENIAISHHDMNVQKAILQTGFAATNTNIVHQGSRIVNAVNKQTEVVDNGFRTTNENIAQQGKRVTSAINYQTIMDYNFRTNHQAVARASMQRVRRNRPGNQIERDLLRA